MCLQTTSCILITSIYFGNNTDISFLDYFYETFWVIIWHSVWLTFGIKNQWEQYLKLFLVADI